MKRAATWVITICLIFSLISCTGDVVEKKPELKEEYNTILSLAESNNLKVINYAGTTEQLIISINSEFIF